MAGVYDNCAQCGAPMNHPPGKGKARKYCGKDCSVAANAERKAAKVYAKCSVDGCCSPADRVGAGLCEAHYMRVRRHGSTHKLSPAHEGNLVHSGGYILKAAPGNPRALGGYRAYEHRLVFTKHHGEGPFTCHWCGTKVTWDDMHVDHLNDNRSDNDINNLVSSCPTCNQSRGRWKMLRTVREKNGVEIRGEVRTMNEWSAIAGISRSAIQSRIKRGWSIEWAVFEPRGNAGPKRTNMGRGINL